MHILVNADDFGYSPAVNQTIIELYRQERVHSISILVTMPTSNDAISMAIEQHLPTGIHLDLSKGRAIGRHSMSCWLIDADGYFLPTRVMLSRVLLGLIKQKEIEAELRAQIELALAKGITPSHLDSQGHWQAYPPLHQLVRQLAIEYHIPRVRRGNIRRVLLPTPISRRFLPTPHSTEHPRETNYLLSLHHWINHRGKLNQRRYTQLIHYITTMPGSLEIVTHPGVYPDPDFPHDSLPSYRRALESAYLYSAEFDAILQAAPVISPYQQE